MKRLVISICVVLLMAAVSHAAVIDLEWGSGGKALTLAPCETAEINVLVTLGPGETMMSAAWFLLADEDGVVAPGGPLDFEVVGYSEHLPGWQYDRSANPPFPNIAMNDSTGEFPVGTKKGLSENIQDPALTGIGEGTWLVADYVIHCVSESDDVIYFNTHALYVPIFTGSDWVDYNPDIGEPLTLHQTPEPATIGLLGLGGLVALLRRRR